MNPPDQELVRQAKAGESLAFDQLMQRYQREVIAVGYRVLGHYEDSVDLAQETFLRAYRGLPRFREEAAFRTWLYRIALNLARNRRRWYARHRISQTVSLDAPPAGAEEESDPAAERIADPAVNPRQAAGRAEIRGTLHEALNRLPLPFKTAVVLRDIEGLSYEEISEISGERVGTVKSRLHRARGMLRDLLKKEEGVLR